MIRAAAIVLAAGEGRRFGGAKLGALLDGRPLLQHVLDTAALARLDPVIVVLGPEIAALSASIRWRAERRVTNPEPGQGLSSSLRLGLASLAGMTPLPDSVVVLLGDQPRLQPAQVAHLLAAPADPRRPIVVPRYEDGQPGNPVRIEPGGWSLADELHGDRGLAQLFERRPKLVRYLDLPGSNPDVDTPADLAQISRDAGRDLSGRMVAAGRSRPSAARLPRT